MPVGDRTVGAAAPAVRAAVERAEAELGETGRVLLRPSGTEPLVRVMVEAATEETARTVAERIADEVRTASPVLTPAVPPLASLSAAGPARCRRVRSGGPASARSRVTASVNTSGRLQKANRTSRRPASASS